jgi:small-conductance mechanosensitive channel
MRWTDLSPLYGHFDWQRIAMSMLVAAGAISAGLFVNWLCFRAIERIARQTENSFDDLVAKYCRAPCRILLPLVFLNFVSPSLQFPPETARIFEHALVLFLIGSGTYLVVNLTFLARDGVIAHVTRDGASSLSARKVITQIKLLQKIIIALLLVFSVALMLTTFEGIRQIGVSILASAGLAGVIFGLAAQRSLATLLAGLQIAITQPIRLGDVVIVEGEWGTIEEISLTNVVVKIWDLRRLVLPITYFIEKPFQNWTRSSTELLGTVFLYADYSIPIEPLREEASRIVEATELWDGKVCKVQVTEAKASTLEVRVVVSAADSSKAFDLRCLVREKLVSFIQKNYPESLPLVRSKVVAVGVPGPREEAVFEADARRRVVSKSDS